MGGAWPLFHYACLTVLVFPLDLGVERFAARIGDLVSQVGD
jgi:hypothetical protein